MLCVCKWMPQSDPSCNKNDFYLKENAEHLQITGGRAQPTVQIPRIFLNFASFFSSLRIPNEQTNKNDLTMREADVNL